MESALTSQILGAWIAAFLTLAIFSYLYRDNPFYKLAEHIFVGVSAGYWVSMSFWTQIQPNLFGTLWPKSHYSADSIWYRIYDVLGYFSSSIFPAGGIDKGHELLIVYLVPAALGVMMCLSVFSKLSWFARWGIAYTVGMAAGLRAYGYLNSNIIGQIKGSALGLTGSKTPFMSLSGDSILNSVIILIGTVTGLMYFYFSREHKGTFGKVTRIGIYFLMISFGASFGFAVMSRISLLIGRFIDLIDFSSSKYHHASIWVLLIMVAVLGYAAFRNKGKANA
jgi:hypothetical protein